MIESASVEKDFVENSWVGKIKIIGKDRDSAVILRVSGRCTRCMMTTLPQGDLPKDLGILSCIARYNQVSAGVYASVLRGVVIGIDMTDEMLEKARNNAKENGYVNVEFRKGDIETRIPIENNSIDVVISNCVINLTANKVNTFKEVYRILKPDGIGRMIISDLVTDKEIDKDSIDPDKWCSCIDGALTRENYLESISRAGFSDVKVLEEKLYMNNENVEGRRITSLVIKAVKI